VATTAKKTIGIIGFGNFGEFMARHLAHHFEVLVWTRRPMNDDIKATGARPATFDEVAQCDVIIPSVPARHLEDVLTRLGKKIKSGALVVDVASVKLVPVSLMERLLPKSVDLLATHPLFGPQSGAGGLKGLKMVTWPVRINNERYAAVQKFLVHKLGLVLIEMSPDEHDREMAYVQALTFYMGQALDRLNIPVSPLLTRTYQHLLDIRDIVSGDSLEVFDTIQLYNKHADKVRRELRETLRLIEKDLADRA
jgi:prephenate dehydrogenase